MSGRGRGRSRGPPPAQPPPPPQGRGQTRSRGPPAPMSKPMQTKEEKPGDKERSGRGADSGARGSSGDSFDLVVTRPENMTSKAGNSGSKVDLLSNYFVFSTKPDFCLYQYRVDFNVEEDRTFVRRAILHRVQNRLPKYLFDGTMLLSVEQVYPHKQKDSLTLTGSRRTTDGEEPVEIKIRLVGEVRNTDHHYIQFLNMIMMSAMEGLKLVKLDRSFYDPEDKKLEPRYKLEIWPGYSTSIRQHEEKILMCAEVSSKILRTDTVYDQIRVLNEKRMDNPKLFIQKSLIGTVVMTRYNRKTYRIDDVDWKSSPKDSFELKGVKVTFSDYFFKKYSLKCTDLNQPLLISMPTERDRRGGRKEPVALIPEFCTITGQDDAMRGNFRLQQDLAKYTRMDPENRVIRLNDLNKRLQLSAQSRQVFDDWGLKLESNPVNVLGRNLGVEELTVGRQKSFSYKIQEADWSFGLRDSMFAPAPITRWMFVYPTSEKVKVETFWKEMHKFGGNLTQITAPMWVPIENTRTGTYLTMLRDLVQKGPHMIFVVIPNDKGDTYAAIKKFLCVEQPVPSQIITASKVLKDERKMRTMATKIVIQMSAKLGGQPWKITIPFKSGAMVVGFDTYHDSSRSGKSFGALVASLNQPFTKYFSAVSEHAAKTEMSDQIPGLFQQALERFKKENGGYPKRIFFYRDGVGEGQVKQVVDHEVMKIKNVIANIKGEEQPKLSFIIVSKRINTKFFMKAGGRLGNPLSGTVVDDVVTLPQRYDFFLISQSVRQGTVNPTSYNIVWDENGLSPDKMQMLTYKLCHLYFNWAGTVRVPAPCQYAHKLAYLVGESLHMRPSCHLQDLLYFL